MAKAITPAELARVQIQPLPALPGPPDWSHITHDVFCPLCEYNLRGLRDARCPECGYHFEWAEILDVKLAEHPYLFEIYPGRNAWAYRQTTMGLWRPGSFWKLLHPRQRSRAGRLILFWLLGVPFLLLSTAAMYAGSTAVSMNSTNQYREFMRKILISNNEKDRIVQRWGSMEKYLDIYYPKASFAVALKSRLISGRHSEDFWLNAFILPLLWPLLLWGSLLVFQFSMRRARIKSIHVLRCVVYSFELTLWASVFLLAGAVASSFSESSWFDSTIRTARDLALVLGTYRLWIAYREYLRFDHPLGTAVSAQIMAILAILSFFCLTNPSFAYREFFADPFFQLFVSVK